MTSIFAPKSPELDVYGCVKGSLQSLYLDWVNNFLTRERFAEYYGLTLEEANIIITQGGIEQEYQAECAKQGTETPEVKRYTFTVGKASPSVDYTTWAVSEYQAQRQLQAAFHFPACAIVKIEVGDNKDASIPRAYLVADPLEK